MVEARWAKKHDEVMKLETEKTLLHADIESKRGEQAELSATLTDLRKCILVDRGDYKLIEAERIATIEEIDEKLVDLKIELEEKQGSVKNLSATATGLQNQIPVLEKDIVKKTVQKTELTEEVKKLSTEVEKLKENHKNEAEEKRLTLKGLITEINSAREKTRTIKKEYEDTRLEILRETRLLSIRRSDLEIYEIRMRKKYPNETFILNNAAIT